MFVPSDEFVFSGRAKPIIRSPDLAGTVDRLARDGTGGIFEIERPAHVNGAAKHGTGRKPTRIIRSRSSSDRIGIVVGLGAEAQIARRMGRVIVGTGTATAAAEAAKLLIRENVGALFSFGLAGGLDPALRPGALVIPREVLFDGERYSSDPNLLQALGGPNVETVFDCLAIAASEAVKRRLWEQTGAAAVDTESGAVASVASRHGVPFAVLRAVCDPAERTLPRAALIALDQAGAIRSMKVLASVAAWPSQIPALIQLACDAAVARRALIRRVAELGDRLALV